MRIALDAMGGDHAPKAICDGIRSAAQEWRDDEFVLIGPEEVLKPLFADGFPSNVQILHAAEWIGPDEEPVKAVRRKKESSLVVGCHQVKEGKVDAFISAGNTGALMAAGLLYTGRIPGIDRPALAPMFPSLTGRGTLVLDVGANPEAKAHHLAQYALMGSIYSEKVLGFENPRVGLLNIGTEETKGTDALRVAAAQLQAATGLALSFDGFVESDKINRGEVDVVVTDGFSGNLALKAIEGAARFVTDLLRNAFTSSLRSKIGFLVSRPATELLRHHLDPNNHNGAVFLGLNGVVVKSHGSASAAGVANAVAVAARLLEEDLTHRISADLAALGEARLRVTNGNGGAK